VIKKVAIVTESFLPQINGVTNSIVRVLETLKQHEIEAIVIAPTAPSQKHLGFMVHTTNSMPLFQFAVALPGPSVARLLEDFQPEVIHVAAPFLLGAQAINWGTKNNVPTVAIYQTDVAGYLERYNLAFAKSAMEKAVASIHAGANLNLAPTAESAAYLRDIGGGRVKVWGRGVDLDLFNPNNRSDPKTIMLRQELAPMGQKVIGFVGRLAAEKQVHRMEELIDLPNTSLVIVGDGPERNRLEGLFGNKVRFLGALSGMDLAAAYAAMDLFVHFGTEETFGQTIQEALASGLVVIAPNVGGPKHLIDDQVNGFLADHTQHGLYRKLALHTFADPLMHNRISKAAVRSVEGRSWASNNAKLLQYYEDAQAYSRMTRAEQIELA
jgi:phosphatidylinositol alpha 1,6-mannosyltransferase